MARVITRGAAAVVEQLELDGDVLVSVDRLTELLDQLGIERSEQGVRSLAYELQRHGWLGRLRTRHVWEFLPGARGGPYGSGDRYIEFRAQREVNRGWGGVLAMESAASVLGFAQRVPEREVVALPAGHAFPKALASDWRYIRFALPEAGLTVRNGLPTWSLEGLVVGIAARPSGYRDMAGLGQWLSGGVGRVDVGIVIDLLAPLPSTARQRAAYLIGVGGNPLARDAIASVYPATETAWFGPRGAGGRFDGKTQVNDTMLHKYLEAGSGG